MLLFYDTDRIAIQHVVKYICRRSRKISREEQSWLNGRVAA